MGRYYTGDIEGKLWPRQLGNDADHFGVPGNDVTTYDYYYDDSNLESIYDGISECLNELKGYKEKLDEWYSQQGVTRCAEYLNISQSEADSLMEWYARLQLGEKILNKVKEQGHCSFTSEA